MTCKPKRPDDDCKCHQAVMTAYEGMKHCGDETALDAAVRVYRFHHPEDTIDVAALTVERWVSVDHIH